MKTLDVIHTKKFHFYGCCVDFWILYVAVLGQKPRRFCKLNLQYVPGRYNVLKGCCSPHCPKITNIHRMQTESQLLEYVSTLSLSLVETLMNILYLFV